MDLGSKADYYAGAPGRGLGVQTTRAEQRLGRPDVFRRGQRKDGLVWRPEAHSPAGTALRYLPGTETLLACPLAPGRGRHLQPLSLQALVAPGSGSVPGVCPSCCLRPASVCPGLRHPINPKGTASRGRQVLGGGSGLGVTWTGSRRLCTALGRGSNSQTAQGRGWTLGIFIIGDSLSSC